jgi:hypothetical protein
MPMNKDKFLAMLDKLEMEYPELEEATMELRDGLLEADGMPAEDEEDIMLDEDMPMPPPRPKAGKSPIPPELEDDEEDEEELV